MVKACIRGTAIHASATMALVNKTGSWRLSEPVIEHTKCTGCKICSEFCPDGCIERLNVDKSAPPSAPRIRIDMEYCKGCGICANECPQGAIMMLESEA